MVAARVLLPSLVVVLGLGGLGGLLLNALDASGAVSGLVIVGLIAFAALLGTRAVERLPRPR